MRLSWEEEENHQGAFAVVGKGLSVGLYLYAKHTKAAKNAN